MQIASGGIRPASGGAAEEFCVPPVQRQRLQGRRPFPPHTPHPPAMRSPWSTVAHAQNQLNWGRMCQLLTRD